MKTPHKPLLDISSGVESIVWPPVVHGRAAMLTTLLHQFEDSQWQAPALIEKYQYEQLEKLAAHAARHSPYFRGRLEQAGLTVQELASPEGLRRFPPLTRSEIQAAGASLYCTEVPTAHLPVVEVRSSGSTGEPVTVKKTSRSHLVWSANTIREHFWHGRDFSGSILNIRTVSLKQVGVQKGWGEPVGSLFATGQTMGVPITFSPREQVDAIAQFKPNHILTYPSVLEAIVALCEKENRTFAIDHIWCISETVKPELRSRTKAVFGVGIEDSYSCNEIGIAALQCPGSGQYHIMSESVILEVLDDNGHPCAEGETGRVVLTDLHNYATPLIRYDIGDIAEVGGPCSCGKGLPTLKAIKGRVRNLVAKPNGSRHWLPLMPIISKSGLPIQQMQIIQHSFEEIEVNLVTEQRFTEAEEGILTDHLLAGLDHPFRLRFTYFSERLPRMANGKFEDYICRV